SKIEAGRMTLERIPVDVRALTEDAARAYGVLASHKSVRLGVEVCDSVPSAVCIDPLRLRQIIVNLLSNAVKFTDAGSIGLRVWAAEDSPKDAQCCVDLAAQKEGGGVNGRDRVATGFPGAARVTLNLEVRDTGMGIPHDKLERIFEKFTQGDGSISRRFGGSGLGLTITRRLAELHGGAIHVESEPGVGSTFTVTLQCETAGRTDITAVRAARACILVVDDNAVSRRMVTSILEKGGYSTAAAIDGREAIGKLERGKFDLVLMDVQMPGMDGLEATRQIRGRKELASLPIVAMTAHAMDGDQEMCLRAGMSGYISKPVHADHLLHTVDVMLNAAQEAGKPAAHD
ncbi:MAG TPA: response regulator, partial [Bryobacteraceae bacterium]|nr:response regulator [Bryobacteraceae bacterium]